MSPASPESVLEAAGDLALVLRDDALHVSWGEPDWLGPCTPSWAARGASLAGQPAERTGEDDLGAWHAWDLDWQPGPGVRTSVRAYRERPLLVFRLEAARALEGVAGEAFDAPAVAWPWFRPAERTPDGLPDGARAFGHAYTEFAVPTQSDPDCAGFFLLPQRPAAVQPLWLLAPDGRALLLAPLDHFHEQVIAVPRGAGAREAGVRCGWHGDLDRVPGGFATELAVWAGPGPRQTLDALASALRARHATRRPSRYADSLGSHLSYWTDNGAAYWYRTEAGRGVEGTLAAVAERLRRDRVPVRAFQLDSWFYPHEKLRPFDDGDAVVPPTGLVTWEPRPDALPDGIPALRRALGDPPLATHCRHLSSASPYCEPYEVWTDADRAHPVDASLYERFLDSAVGWGVEVFEHDWLIECFLGVRGLREEPGRARRWQEGLDRAAAARGLTLQWCMASPADFFQTLTLERVSSIRTSGDYRYIIGNGALWAWFLYGNALARALGLHPFKDVFLSSRAGEGLDGDAHAEVEALLSALSAGPVGLGDRLGRSDRELVLRTCREDGLLVKPDVPIAALERSYQGHAVLEPNPLLAEAHSEHPAGRWLYVVALNVWRGDEPLRVRLQGRDLGGLCPEEAVAVYDWRRGTFARFEPGSALELELGRHGDPDGCWDYRVWCPILPGEIALLGDPTRFASAGDRRIARVVAEAGSVAFDVLGAPGEAVPVAGWSARAPTRASSWTTGGSRAADFTWDSDTGRWDLRVELPASGSVRVTVETR